MVSTRKLNYLATKYTNGMNINRINELIYEIKSQKKKKLLHNIIRRVRRIMVN